MVQKQTTTANINPHENSQLDLYSPRHAVPLNTQPQEDHGIIMVNIKDKILEKLAAASVPADAIDNARTFLESVVKDFGVAAHSLTQDALSRIRTHLVTSLSPNFTAQMVDDAEKEARSMHKSRL